MTLGLPVLPSYAKHFDRKGRPIMTDEEKEGEVNPLPGDFVLTRLHARYDAQSLAEDLVFEAAPAIEGGSGTPDQDGKLDGQTAESIYNRFQARYAILHRWTDMTWCFSPQRGRWGHRVGPPRSATNLAFQARDAKLEDFVGADAHLALGLPGEPREQLKSCNCASKPDPTGPLLFGLGSLGLLGLRARTKATRS
jgi:MYXO-CTERM domain-containing protein